jgi:hypothetical protein
MQRIEAYSKSEIRFNLMALVRCNWYDARSQLLHETQAQSNVHRSCRS